MPLLEPDTKEYFLHSDVIYVDTGLDKADENHTNSDFVVRLTKQVSNVVGFEMIRYDLPDAAFSPLIGATAVDFQLSNSVIGTETFTAWLGSSNRPLTISNPPTNLELTRISQAFTYATLGSTAYGEFANIIVSADSSGKLRFTSKPGSGVFTQITLLFGSGANTSQSAAKALGFTTESNRTGATVGNDRVVVADQAPATGEAMYIDVTIDEARELNPLRRIYVGENRLVFNETSDKTRLLTDPIHRLKELTFKLRIKKPDGTEVEIPFDDPMFFEIKVTYIHPVIETPEYVQDRLMAL